jgi:hypothetical protein
MKMILKFAVTKIPLVLSKMMISKPIVIRVVIYFPFLPLVIIIIIMTLLKTEKVKIHTGGKLVIAKLLMILINKNKYLLENVSNLILL